MDMYTLGIKMYLDNTFRHESERESQYNSIPLLWSLSNSIAAFFQSSKLSCSGRTIDSVTDLLKRGIIFLKQSQ